MDNGASPTATPDALRIDWASHEAAVYATRRWHYSRTVPPGKTVKVGAWERGRFIGVVIFARGATPEIGSPYGLDQTTVCELVRIALDRHLTPVSRIVAIALRFLKQHCPDLRLVVSFADEGHGHHGGIYQAGNWIYTGGTVQHAYRIHGRLVHPKSLHSKYGVGGQSIPWLRANVDPKAERVASGIKHRYLMPLDKDLRATLAQLHQPYPRRAKQATSAPSVSAAVQPRPARSEGDSVA
jgi:hypothetical protein